MSNFYIVRTVQNDIETNVDCIAYGLAKQHYDECIESYGSDAEVSLMKVEVLNMNTEIEKS